MRRQRTRALACALALLGVLATPGRAAAETVAVLTPSTERGVEKDLVTHSLQVVARWLAERGLQVAMPERTAPRVPPHLRDCRRRECALAYLEHLDGVDSCVLTHLRPWDGAPGPSEIDVTFVTRDGHQYRESWPVVDSTALALDAALTHAYTRYLRGPGPWISVHGTPRGAEVLIDGKQAGVLPYHGRIGAGEHLVGVRRNGFEPYVRTVLISKAAGAHEEMEVALRQLTRPGPDQRPAGASGRLRPSGRRSGTGAEASAHPLRHREERNGARIAAGGEGSDAAREPGPDSGQPTPSTWNYILGGTLLAGSAALMVFPVVTAIKDGQCAEEDDNGLCRRYHFGAQSVALVAGSAACMAAGAVLLFTLPISENSSV